jgi:RNA polymerase sigma-70 factor (ECF subfamily)
VGRPDGIDDDEGFIVMVRENSAAVHAYLARRAGRQVADELLSDIWLRAFASRGGYDPSWRDPRPWLYGIARNVLRAYWRSATRPTASGTEGSVDPWSRVDERLDVDRIGPILASGLAELSNDDREMLLLVAWEQLSPSEAALVLEIPSGTARSRLHRARQLLQRYLDSQILPASFDDHCGGR